MAQLVLLPGKDRSLARRHPWIFAAASTGSAVAPAPGDTVDVVAANGRPLAKAAWSPESKIRARVWTFDPDEIVDDAFFKRHIQAAVERRWLTPELRGQDGLRLVHGESDGLPGLIADRYGDTVVVQLTATGPEKWRRRSSRRCSVRRLRAHLRAFGFACTPPRRVAAGDRLGVRCEAPAEKLCIVENGVRMRVDVVAGHKTGFYLDQRDNRLLDARPGRGPHDAQLFLLHRWFLAAGARRRRQQRAFDRLVGAGAGDGHRQPGAQPATRREPGRVARGRRLHRIARLKSAGQRFDLIILDPPKFAPSAAHAERAARAYRDINVMRFRLLNPGGLLMSYSCSGGISSEHFQRSSPMRPSMPAADTHPAPPRRAAGSSGGAAFQRRRISQGPALSGRLSLQGRASQAGGSASQPPSPDLPDARVAAAALTIIGIADRVFLVVVLVVLLGRVEGRAAAISVSMRGSLPLASRASRLLSAALRSASFCQ
jgi:23S rRNA (cytosine1962-C5)-methyltransferase